MNLVSKFGYHIRILRERGGKRKRVEEEGRRRRRKRERTCV